ncbi:MAG: sugar ABC transporter substrate-binding protein [Reyranella sp.]|uniref:ABC transporter substrate-binding protein n=1 Tax=Reyranella sp. TaxID=1929291 RepID=UPI003D0D1354
MQRRQLLKSTAALSAASFLAAPAIAQGTRKITYLTWNLVHLEGKLKGWIKGFVDARPGVEVEWVDKKGPELPAYYQTQLAAGTPPDIIDIQGALGLEYAAQGALLDLTSRLAAEAALKDRYEPAYLANWVYEGANYMVPYYVSKTLLFWNKTRFKEAGLAKPPASFDEILSAAGKIKGAEKTGLMTLNFDWLYWPLLRMNDVELLSPDLKKATFNTPRAAEVVTRLAEATKSGAINPISWTGRWVEPNEAFATGNVGMLNAHAPAFFWIKGKGPWINGDTLGAAQMPGNWATPNSHGLGISKGSKNPDLAWDFVKYLTDAAVASDFARIANLLTGNKAVDKAQLARLQKDDPLAFQVLSTQLEYTDRMCGNWRLGNDSRVKDAFWPEFQSAMLGRKDAKTALADAERRVSRELRRA